jgi:hypothetical protein
MLRQLYDTIMNSTNRLTFIRHRMPPTNPPEWHLVQIDLDATNPQLAKTVGTYCALWMTPHHNDRTHYPLTHCRFWPHLIRQTRDTTQSVYVSPDKVEHALRNDPTLTWLSADVNLAEDLLVGPFDFATMAPDGSRPNNTNLNRRSNPRLRHGKFSQTIDLTQWDQLVIACKRMGLNAANVDTKPDQNS